MTKIYDDKGARDNVLEGAEKRSMYAKERWKRIRLDMFEALGGAVCVNCGFTDYRALQVDHINGGGMKEHRENPQFKSFNRWAEHVKLNKEKYQVLCANCNQIKRYTHNEFTKKN